MKYIIGKNLKKSNSISIEVVFFFSAFVLLYLPESAISDARVDGFYPTDFVSNGYFKDKHFAKNTDRKKFFVTREERAANPASAPSNSIEIPQNTIRVSNRMICLPGFGNCSETLVVYPRSATK